MYLRLGGLDMEIDPVIHGRDSGQLIRLSDVATIRRGYQEIPQHLIRMNGKPAIALGISFADEVNVVEVGQRIDDRLAQQEQFRPAGISVENLYNQPNEVKKSVKGFLLNLGTSLLIVIGALLLTMGWRSGLVVGATLLLTMLGTFILMKIGGWQLHRLSLGALIIALGMLVDNAIVVVEGAMVGVTRGVSKRQALRDRQADQVASARLHPYRHPGVHTLWPFGFGHRQIMKAMFWVLTYSLFLSWILAISLTPFLVDILMRDVDATGATGEDPYRAWPTAAIEKVLDTR